MDEIKVNYHGTIKKFLFPQKYEELLNTISTSFNIPKDNIIFNYIDEEGDKIVIASECDYNHIINLSKKSKSQILKLSIETNNKLLEFNKSETISCIGFDENNTINLENNNELKSKIKTQIHQEIDHLTENFKNKLTTTIDYKINTMLSKEGSLGGGAANIKQTKCLCCKGALGTDYIFKCFLCDEFIFCKNCGENAGQAVDLAKHIMIKYTSPDLQHIEAFKGGQLNKTNFNKFNFSNIIAFNTVSDRIVIDVNNTDEDYLNHTFRFTNMSKYNIQPGDTFECLFDDSDIFGNKITFSDTTIYKNEDFEINVLFYGFTNKSPGFYKSKWNFVFQQNLSEKYPVTFVFSINREHNEESSMLPFQRVRKLSENIAHNRTNLTNLIKKKNIGKTVSVPDLYSELIKKYQENSNNINK
jgi:hypothetical protein